MKRQLFRLFFWGSISIFVFLAIVGIGITATSMHEANIPIKTFISGDLTAEQDRKISEIIDRRAGSLASTIVKFFEPKTKYSDFFEKADLIYEPTEWVPYTEQEAEDILKKGQQMQEDAFKKALEDAINFDNTTLKDARDQGIKNAGGID